MYCSRRTALLAVLSMTMLPLAVLAADPLEGNWQLNLDKSTFRQTPGPKGQMRIYRISDGVEKMIARGINAEQQSTFVSYEARYDGKDYDIRGSTGGDRIALRRIDATTTESTQKRDGKAAIVATRQVSADGKTLTVTSKGTLPDGRIIDAVMVFDRH